MALAYLDSWDLHGSAEVVSNNHFDQDGLTSAFAFVDPDGAAVRSQFLTEVGAAGDFATTEDRAAARVSMTIAAFADKDRTPLESPDEDYETWCATLYQELLGRLPELCEHPERFRNLWAAEDATLDASQAAIATGGVLIEEIPALDLAVVTVPDDAPTAGGHRFASQWTMGLHPIAINNATSMLSLLTIRGATCEFAYRYESWVQYRSRRPRPRVDLGPLAEQLTADETSGVHWVADRVSGLTPTLHTAGSEQSSLPADHVRGRLIDHLTSSSPAFDPYPA